MDKGMIWIGLRSLLIEPLRASFLLREREYGEKRKEYARSTTFDNISTHILIMLNYFFTMAIYPTQGRFLK